MKKLPLLILAILSLGLPTAVSKTRRGPTDEDIRKADYLYLEALRAKSQGQGDAAFDLLMRARELNPADEEIGEELAGYVLSISEGDSVVVAQGVEMMRDYYDKNQDGYF